MAGPSRKGLWSTQTPDDEAFFLYTQILKGPRAFATVMTLEASGEHYQQVLEGATPSGRLLHSKHALERTIARMLNEAAGLLILLDPSDSANDATYLPLLSVMVHELNVRARDLLRRQLDAVVQEPSRPPKGKDKDQDPQPTEAEFARGRELWASVHPPLEQPDPEAMLPWQMHLIPVIELLDRKFPGAGIRQKALAELDRSGYAEESVRNTWKNINHRHPEAARPVGPAVDGLPSGGAGQAPFQPREIKLRKRIFEMGYPPKYADWFDLDGAESGQVLPPRCAGSPLFSPKRT